jgi:DNA-binding NarL/FixJ family response regulator
MQSQPIRVLLAENAVSETGITLRSLYAQHRRGLELVFVSNRDSLTNGLLHFRPHVSVLALSLLQPDPYRAISLLHYSVPGIPQSFLLFAADRDCAAKCLEAGAHDYMLEGFIDEATLDRILRSAIQQKSSLDSNAIPD